MLILVLFLIKIKNSRHFQKPLLDIPFWSNAERLKAQLPRYIRQNTGQIPIWILSVRKFKDRRERVESEFSDISFEFINGVDVEQTFPVDEFRMLFGGPRFWFANRGDRFAQMKLSIDHGHIKALLKLASSEYDMAVILEDDSSRNRQIHLQQELSTILTRVPMDWDIIYLAEIGNPLLSKVEAGKGIKTVKSTSCTLAYIMHRKGAFKVLTEVFSSKVNLNIDLLYSELIKDGILNAYLTSPGLIKRSDMIGGSTLNYSKGKNNRIYSFIMNDFG
jgi:hypothetical protein